MPETSYATRAKLTLKTPSDEDRWSRINPRVRTLGLREHLLVSNTGPKSDGYTYCVSCGRIEATSEPSGLLFTAHRKPYPDEKEPNCSNPRTTSHVVLGTDYITDVALFSMDVAEGLVGFEEVVALGVMKESNNVFAAVRYFELAAGPLFEADRLEMFAQTPL